VNRIVHIIKATGIAGAEQHLITMLPELDRQSFDVFVIVLTEPRKPVDKLFRAFQQSGVTAERMIINRHIDPSLVIRLILRLRDLAPSIVHTHLIHADLYGTIAARMVGVPVVISSRHNDDPFRTQSPLSVLLRIVNRYTNRFIAISERVRGFTIEHEKVPDSVVDTVYYGLPISEQNREVIDVRSEFGLSKGPLLVCAARLTEQKGHKWLLRAFRSVVDQLPETSLLLLGDGPLRKHLEDTVIKLGISKNVRFAGWRTDVMDILPSTDLFVLASEWEGFGLVLLEAMSLSLSIVATEVGGIPEVVLDGETGWLVKSKDSDALAGSILAALRSPHKMLECGRMGKLRVQNTFSVKKMIVDTEKIYNLLLTQILDINTINSGHDVSSRHEGINRDTV
jgi:glycosyltransferase involved in cell wall biosynthesis